MKNTQIYILLLVLSTIGCRNVERNKPKIETLKNSSIIEQEKETLINEEEISESELISTVLSQLNLTEEKCKNEFISVKDIPNSKELSIVVIPEINFEDEDTFEFELNSYILIVNSKTGKIESKFYETSKTNDWTSDALQLTDITIDTAPYIIGKNTRAFGIRVHYLGSSKPNPYESETISLFIKNGNKLKRVLNKFEINGNFGEWDTTCAGEFTYFDSILIMSNTLTNGYYDINVKTNVTKTTNFEDENGECKSKDVKTINNSKLIFNGNEYKKSLLE